MMTYTVITTDEIETSATHQQYGEWAYEGTHNDGELWEVEVSVASAPAFEAAASADPVIIGFEPR